MLISAIHQETNHVQVHRDNYNTFCSMALILEREREREREKGREREREREREPATITDNKIHTSNKY